MKCAFLAPVAALVVVAVCTLRPIASIAEENLDANKRVFDFSEIKASRGAIEQALEEQVDVNFEETPLKEVIDGFEKRHEIEIVIDARVLADAGIDPATLPITATLSGISLKSALAYLLNSQGLVAIPHEEMLLITTRESADSILATRVYGVVDLIEVETNADPHGGALVDLIESTVATQTWATLGGPGTLGGWNGIITISQTHEVHQTIEELLSALREFRKRQSMGKIDEPVFIGGVQRPPPKIEKLLALKTNFNYEETPLSEVMADLKNNTGIEFHLDSNTLNDAGIDPPTTPITLKLQKVAVRAAIERILSPQGLAWIYKNELPLITTKEDADCQLTIGVYPVADMFGPHSQTEAEKKLGFPVSNADELIDLIVSNIATQTWSDLGGPGTIEAFDAEFPVVVCNQTSEVHHQIAQFLADLRRVRSGQAEELADQAAVPLKPPTFVLRAYPLKPGDQTVPAIPPKEIMLLVKALTGTNTWEAEDAFIQAMSGRLIVRHNATVQRKVRKILEEIDALGQMRPGMGGGFGGGGFGGGGF